MRGVGIRYAPALAQEGSLGGVGGGFEFGR